MSTVTKKKTPRRKKAAGKMRNSYAPKDGARTIQTAEIPVDKVHPNDSVREEVIDVIEEAIE